MYDNDLQCYGGLQSNDLNVIMYNDDDENDDNEIPNIGHSAYIDTSELTKYLVNHKMNSLYWVWIFKASMRNLILCMPFW